MVTDRECCNAAGIATCSFFAEILKCVVLTTMYIIFPLSSTYNLWVTSKITAPELTASVHLETLIL